MCGEFFQNLFGGANASQTVLPRAPDKAYDSKPIVKQNADVVTDTVTPGISMKRSKKTARRSVPGLNL